MKLVHRIQLISLLLLIALIAAAPAFADAASDTQELPAATEEQASGVTGNSDNNQSNDEDCDSEKGEDSEKEATTDNAALSETDRTDASVEKADKAGEDKDCSKSIQNEIDDTAVSDKDPEAEAKAEEASETSPSDDPELTLVTIGHGDLSLDKEGKLSCIPDTGYEIISITADKDAEGVKKGREIPETGISEITFRDDTTITAIFGKIPEDNMLSTRPLSARAAFGTTDESQQL